MATGQTWGRSSMPKLTIIPNAMCGLDKSQPLAALARPVSYLQSPKNHELSGLTIGESLAQIRGGQHREIIDQYRQAYHQAWKSAAESAQAPDVVVRRANEAVKHLEIESRLPAITPAGTFDQLGGTLRSYSGLVCLELEDMGERPKDVVRRLKEHATKIPHVFAAFLSPSSYGLILLVAVPNQPERHQELWQAAAQLVEKQLRWPAREASKDTHWLCPVSYDPDLYVNESAAPIPESAPSARPKLRGSSRQRGIAAEYLGEDGDEPAADHLDEAENTNEVERTEAGTNATEVKTASPTISTLPVLLQESLKSCPDAGSGVHSWLLGTANRCRNAGVPTDQATQLIGTAMTRPPSPPNEVEMAVEKAYREGDQWQPSGPRQARFVSPGRGVPLLVPITKIQYTPAKLSQVAGRITQPANWRRWLFERSPQRLDATSTSSFLAQLYRHGETVLVFDTMQSRQPLASVSIASPMKWEPPAFIHDGGRGGLGIWFLCNPVDACWHPNPRQDGKPSCRSEESVTSFRYAVLESDQAPADQWLAFIVQLPVPIAAIYTSGGRSIHALVRVDVPSKAAWDEIIGPLKRPLKVLGADPACLSAVRLTRLPGCWRPEKRGYQKLLYLCPEPQAVPLRDLPVISSREELLARKRQHRTASKAVEVSA